MIYGWAWPLGKHDDVAARGKVDFEDVIVRRSSECSLLALIFAVAKYDVDGWTGSNNGKFMKEIR